MGEDLIYQVIYGLSGTFPLPCFRITDCEDCHELKALGDIEEFLHLSLI